MDDPALIIGFTILVWCRDSGLVPCWLLHAVTLSFASTSRHHPGGDHSFIGVYFQYKKRLFSIQHTVMYHYHDAIMFCIMLWIMFHIVSSLIIYFSVSIIMIVHHAMMLMIIMTGETAV